MMHLPASLTEPWSSNRRYTVKDLLNHEFFADTVRVEMVDDVEEDSVQVRMRLEVPGNREVPKNSQQAIEFDYNIENDDPEAVVEEMVSGVCLVQYVHACTCLCECVCVCTCVCVCVRMCVHVCVRVHMCVHMCVCVRAHVCLFPWCVNV